MNKRKTKMSKKINLPTILTLIRIVLVVPLMLCLFNLNLSNRLAFLIIAFLCFVIAAVTDFIDGRLARKNHQVTDLGAFLDPLADKMLVNLTIFAFSMMGLLQPWFFIVILVRDFAVDGMRMMVAKTGETVSASIWGKAKTMTQMVFLASIFIECIVFYFVADYVARDVVMNINFAFQIVIALMTVYSGMQYLVSGYKKVIK